MVMFVTVGVFSFFKLPGVVCLLAFLLPGSIIACIAVHFLCWRNWRSERVDNMLHAVNEGHASDVLNLAEKLGIEVSGHGGTIPRDLLDLASPILLGKFLSSLLYLLVKQGDCPDVSLALLNIGRHLYAFLGKSWVHNKRQYLEDFEDGLKTSRHPDYATLFHEEMRQFTDAHTPENVQKAKAIASGLSVVTS